MALLPPTPPAARQVTLTSSSARVRLVSLPNVAGLELSEDVESELKAFKADSAVLVNAPLPVPSHIKIP